jgi:hypothetical protein
MPPAAAPAMSVAPPAPDPFASTVLGDNVAAVLLAAQAPAAYPQAQPYAPQPSPAPPAAQPQYAQPPPQPANPIAPGTMVLVYWADGQRYPGTVLQVSPQHVFVAFPNGIQQWIDVRYVTVGG